MCCWALNVEQPTEFEMRRRNAQFAEKARAGKNPTKPSRQESLAKRSPVGVWALGIICFVVMGGGMRQLLRCLERGSRTRRSYTRAPPTCLCVTHWLLLSRASPRLTYVLLRSSSNTTPMRYAFVYNKHHSVPTLYNFGLSHNHLHDNSEKIPCRRASFSCRLWHCQTQKARYPQVQ